MKSGNSQACHLPGSLEAETSKKESPMQKTSSGILPYCCLSQEGREEGGRSSDKRKQCLSLPVRLPT